ncbi:hypothetical protein [Amycolatopsis sp. GM8]|uniref:hypothetical protein n=1 Tax=Amycolatopsis sp. GM8 TaxID=2896530 RepID=UPI001F25758A|nr:hypothetical protein [Amycolatopsis sp. GM8]
MTVFDQAKAIGDALLYEGYLLYPYRASATKNRLRWQFGVLMPPAFASAGHGEYADCHTECLLEPGGDAVLRLRLRFLQAKERPEFDEVVEREIDAVLPVGESGTVPFTVDGLRGEIRVRFDALPGPYGGLRVRAEIANTTSWSPPEPTREQALRHALLAAHLVLVAEPGRFLSLLDPPEWAAPAAQACRNERLWPVMIAEDAMLASPIILYDYPSVAPESAGELFDGTEIDEILTLRTMALTEDEKREARETDERARALIDRVDGMPPELLDRLHGTIRQLRAATIPGPGSRVRLHAGRRRADAQDMFLDGRIATVRKVLSDVDGKSYLAVTVDDDPAAEFQQEFGRYRYFSPDEVEPLREEP